MRHHPGDLHVFPLGCDGLAGWVLLKHHPEEEGLILAVPADEEPLVGPMDVRAAPTRPGEGSLVMRCNRARWVREEDLWWCAAEGRVPRHDRVRALSRLQALVEGTIPDEPEREEEEDSEAYRWWDREVVAPAEEALSRWSGRRRSELEVRTGTIDGALRRLLPDPVPLAARSDDDPLRAAALEATGLRVEALEFDAEHPGIRLACSRDGVVPVCGPHVLAPRLFALMGRGRRRFVEWEEVDGPRRRSPRRLEGQLLEWQGDRLHLVLDEDPVVEVVVHRPTGRG